MDSEVARFSVATEVKPRFVCGRLVALQAMEPRLLIGLKISIMWCCCVPRLLGLRVCIAKLLNYSGNKGHVKLLRLLRNSWVWNWRVWMATLLTRLRCRWRIFGFPGSKFYILQKVISKNDAKVMRNSSVVELEDDVVYRKLLPSKICIQK